jgi:predicted flap endonuclease-1-like 5' DNA nuclease
MLYLASRFVWFLLGALILGFVMGLISRSGRSRRFWSGGWTFMALLWAGGAALTWFQRVNGVQAMWLETALLFVAVYWLGCVIGTMLRPLGTAVTEAEPASMAATPAATDAAPAAASAVVADRPVSAGGVPALAETAEALPGERPAALTEARGGEADDLKLIKGIGRQNEGRLHGLGIWHFDQIAAWTPENVEWVGSYLAFPGRIEREDWVGQAKLLAAGGSTEFADRARAGLVETSRDDGSAGEDNVAALAAGSFEGRRPAQLLSAARDGKADDLTLIKGVGPPIAADLNRLGIWHFDQVAALDEEEMRYASAFAGAPGRGLSENWREDAAILAAGGETQHSRALKAGRGKAE